MQSCLDTSYNCTAFDTLENTSINDTTYYKVKYQFNTNCQVDSSAYLNIKSGVEINLTDSFEVKKTASFLAEIEPCWPQ